ncbi:MAG: PQQ-binding-like beta-propeller repeat protein [Acidobacteria bacterium]|nr:PQQ-binding-like beta-propeller repeat protein [Acidobacteriota bacterium]
MKIGILATAVLAVSCGIASIDTASAGETLGIRLLDAWRYTRIYCALAASDGGTILAGGTGSYWDHDGDDGLLAKLDADGNFVWKRIFGGSGTDRLLWVMPADDGGYIAAGSTQSMGYQRGTWLVHVEESGRPLWRRSYDTKAHPGRLVPIPSGGYAISAGSSILRLGPSGDVLWQRSYSIPVNEYYGTTALVAASDGGYLFASGDTCARTTGDGELIWIKNLGNLGIRDACETPDGDFLLVGDGAIVRLDTAGQLAWAMQYESAQAEEPHLVFTGIQPDVGGELLVAGSIGYQYWWTRSDRASCMRIDASGEIVWQRKLVSEERESKFYSSRPLPSGGFLLGGHIWTMGEGAGEDGLLVRMTSSGEVGTCSDLFRASAFMATPLEVTLTDGDPTVTDQAAPAYVKATGLMATWEAVSWSPCAGAMEGGGSR